jgi:hypothetical protein
MKFILQLKKVYIILVDQKIGIPILRLFIFKH